MGATIQRVQFSRAILLVALLAGCAHTLNVLDRVQLGQGETEALQAVQATPSRIVDGGNTKYIVYGFIATFVDMYSETVTHYYIKLENGKVVAKGMLRREVVKEIRILDPEFPYDS